MPLFDFPDLSSAVFHDGTRVLPGDTVVPVLVVVDERDKASIVQGEDVLVEDRAAPVLAGFAASRDPATLAVAPAAGTVLDYSSGTIHVYHVAALPGFSPTAAGLLALVRDPANAEAGFGAAAVSPNEPGLAVSVAGLSGLSTSSVYDGEAFRAASAGDSVVVSHLVAVDPAGLVSSAAALAEDRDPPAFSVAPALASAGTTSLTVGWTLEDAGDSAVAAATPLYVGVYSASGSPSSADVVAGAGDGFIRMFQISDGKAASSWEVGSGSPAGNDPLDPGTGYRVYLAAEDSSGNLQAEPALVAATTASDGLPDSGGLVFRQTVPYIWPTGLSDGGFDLNASDVGNPNFSRMNRDTVEQFRNASGEFHFVYRYYTYAADAEPAEHYSEWKQTSNPHDPVAGLVVIKDMAAGRHDLGGLLHRPENEGAYFPAVPGADWINSVMIKKERVAGEPEAGMPVRVALNDQFNTLISSLVGKIELRAVL